MQRRRLLKALAGAPLLPFIVPDERIWFGEHLEPDDSFEQWCLDGAPDETDHDCRFNDPDCAGGPEDGVICKINDADGTATLYFCDGSTYNADTNTIGNWRINENGMIEERTRSHECVSFITMRQPDEASYRFTDDDGRLEVWIRHGDELHQCHCGHSWSVEPATRYSQQVVSTGTRVILDEGQLNLGPIR